MFSSRIETVMLDAGGVLVFPNWDRVSAVLARHGVAVSGSALRRVEAAARFAIDHAVYVSASSDAERGGRYFDMVLDAANVDRSAGRDAALRDIYAYHMEHNLWEVVPDDVRPALERLRALGLTLVVASNANGVIQRAFDRLGLTPYFRAVCDSCIEGVEKPDPRFFNIVLERAGGRAGTTAHVGDLYHVDIIGARNAGLRAILLDPDDLYGEFDVERIRSLGDLATHLGA